VGKEPPADMNIRVPDIGAAEKPVGRAVVYRSKRADRAIEQRYAFLEEDGHVSVIAGRPRGE
jgi:hypothetical protein